MEGRGITRHLVSERFPCANTTWRQTHGGWSRRRKLNLLRVVEEVGVPTGQHVGKQLYRGITTGLNKAFVVDRETRDQLIADHPSSEDVLKPFLRGRDINDGVRIR